MPQIQGVQGRMPYAAASQQPSTASFGMLLCTQEPEMGVSSAFPKGKQNGGKKRTFITHQYGGYKSDIKNVNSV